MNYRIRFYADFNEGFFNKHINSGKVIESRVLSTIS